jgi:predicted transposase YdaD
MTARPHDALFKSAFEAPSDAAALLRELLPPSVRDAIAWDTLDRDRGSFIDRKLADLHSDLLFFAVMATGEPGLVFFLLEHQSSGDPTLAQRVLGYQLQIWDRFRKERPRGPLPPIVAVLVSHVSGGWSDARAFEELFDPAVMELPGLAPLVPRCSMLTLDLAHLSDDALRGRSLTASQKLALWALRDARAPARLLAGFEAWGPEMVEAGQSRTGLDALSVIFEYLFQILDPVHWDELHAKIRTLGSSTEESTMTIAEMFEERGRTRGLAEGHQKGREEGRDEGRDEGRRATLRSQLLFKFQSLDEASEARLQAATPEAIDRYVRRVLTADSLAAVFED